MLQKSERVTRSEFLRLYKAGKKLHSKHLTVSISPTPGFHGSVVVSKKVSKRAVIRNTIRRRIYSELRSLRSCSPATYIVMVRPPYADLSKGLARAELLELIGRIQKSA